MGKAYVGTSGFSYSHWGKGVFYPQDMPQSRWFEYYCQHFKTVELNVSFYRLPKKETFGNWRKQAGKDFVFAVKGSRYITHVKKMKDSQEPVKRFFKSAAGIKKGKDVVLWQLPPRFKANPERLAQFLKFLPKDWRHAFEFREKSWLDKKIYGILRKYNAAAVFQDYPQWPVTEEKTADFVYFRFHGRKRLYSSNYSEKELKEWAVKIKRWKKEEKDCYAYFNNDALGYALENAKQLRELAAGK